MAAVIATGGRGRLPVIGEIDVKLGFNVKEFIQKMNPMICDIYKRENETDDGKDE